MGTYSPAYVAPYTNTGSPWTNGSAPGISAAFLDAIEGWVYQVDNPPDVVLTGTTAGTATLYETVYANRKEVLLIFAGYENSSSTPQSIVLPHAFTFMAWATSGGFTTSSSNGIQFLLSGTPANIHTCGSLAGGSFNNSTTLLRYCPGAEVLSGFDTLSIEGSYSGAASGIVRILGN